MSGIRLGFKVTAFVWTILALDKAAGEASFVAHRLAHGHRPERYLNLWTLRVGPCVRCEKKAVTA